MSNKNIVFVGITSWNSALFLPVCLEALRRTTEQLPIRVMVLDNASTDDSVALARAAGAEVVVQRCTQPDALNRLLALSDAPYTLLLHADVVLLNPNWFALCQASLNAKTVLVAPEDIGCGPLSRPFGAGMPESSFLFFATAALRRTRIWHWQCYYGRLYLPKRRVDFYGPHVTHRLPQRLADRGYTWQRMGVHYSDTLAQPLYRPPFRPGVWTEELGLLRYGLGNFYSLAGQITHYHNWYERVQTALAPDSQATTGAHGEGFPLAYIQAYTQAFLRDHAAGCLVLPSASPQPRQPMAL